MVNDRTNVLTVFLSKDFWFGAFIGTIILVILIIYSAKYLIKINKIAFDFFYLKIEQKRTKGQILKNDTILITDSVLVDDGILFDENEKSNINNLKFVNTLIESFFELIFDRDLVIYIIKKIEDKVNGKQIHLISKESSSDLNSLMNKNEISNINESGLFSNVTLPLISPKSENTSMNQNSVVVMDVTNTSSKVKNFRINNIEIDNFGLKVTKASIKSVYINKKTGMTFKLEFENKKEKKEENNDNIKIENSNNNNEITNDKTGNILNLKRYSIDWNNYMLSFETLGKISLETSFDFIADIVLMKGTIPLKTNIILKKIFGIMDIKIYNFAKYLQDFNLADKAKTRVNIKRSIYQREFNNVEDIGSLKFIIIAEIKFPSPDYNKKEESNSVPLKAELEIHPYIESSKILAGVCNKITPSVVSLVQFAINFALKKISRDTWALVKELTTGKIIVVSENDLTFINEKEFNN